MCNATAKTDRPMTDRPMTELEKAQAQIKDLEGHIEYLNRQNERLRGEIEGLRFAVRCNGVSGAEVRP